MAFFTMAFEILYFVISSILETTLETIEDIYLFVESHYDRDRDFEKIDDFIDFALRSGFKLFCCAVFVACLALWTWYNLPLKQFSRHDLEAERDEALNLIQQLEAHNSELQTLSEKTLADRNSYRRDFALQATEKIVLENRLGRLQSQLDINADLESSLDQSEAQCRDLESSLQLSRWVRRNDDNEREKLSAQSTQAKSKIQELEFSLDLQVDKIDGYKAKIADLEEKIEANEASLDLRADKIIGYKAKIADLEEKINANEASQAGLELTRLENPRDQANQGPKVEALTARIEELDALLEVTKKDLEVANKDLEANKLDNTRHQLAETERTEAANTECTARIEELENLLEAANENLGANKLDNDRHQLAETRRFEATDAKRTARIEELENLLETAEKKLDANKLDNDRHQLAETALVEAANAERSTLHDQHAKIQDLLQAKIDELQGINAQHLKERESQRIQIKALQDALEVHENAMDVDEAPAHVCDHSKCVDEVNLREERIRSMDASQMGCNVKAGRLQTEANENGLKIEGLVAQLEDRNAAIGTLQKSVDTSNQNWSLLKVHLQLGDEHDFTSIGRLLCQWQANFASQDHKCDHSACESQFLADSNQISSLQDMVSSLTTKVDDKERKISSFTTESKNANRKAVSKVKEELQAKVKELAAEKAGRQTAVETERRIARERFDSSNPLREVVSKLKKDLAEMTTNRDACRAANETYRMQSFKAQNAVKEKDGEQQQVEKQRDGLVKTVVHLEEKILGMVEVEKDEKMEEVQGGSGTSRKRSSDGEEDTRPAKILRDV